MISRNEKTEQALSALFDEELSVEDASPLYGRLAKDTQLQAQWHRHQLIRQAIRREPLALDNRQFADRISAAIQSEPAILAPRRKRSWSVSMLSPKTLALAASVAILAVLVLNYLPGHVTETDQNLMVAEQQAEIKPGPMLVPLQSNYDARFNDYLVSHQQGVFATGMLEHARVVSYQEGP